MIKIKTNFEIQQIKPAIRRSLNQSLVLVEWKAKYNAPVLSWDLKGSINFQSINFVNMYWVVWTNVKYARIREYVNNKNPSKKFYMKRALKSSEKTIKKYFSKNIMEYIIKKK